MLYQHDAAGRRTHADDPNTDLDWHVDAAGQVTKVVDNTLSKTIIYSFDAAGRRTSLDGPEASDTQAWSFDAVGRVTKITENAADRAEWLYDLAGQRTKLTYGSGSFGSWEYDGAGRLTNLVHKKSGGTVIQSFAYVLDKVGNRTKLTLDGGDFVEYFYDPLYQLTKEHRKASGGGTQYWNEFYYDYISNRTKLRHNDGASTTTTTYSYNAADQLTRDVTGATTTDYSYDANGALTRKSSGGSNYDYLYDARSLITKYDAPGTSSDTTYNWDLLDRRVKKDLNGSVTRFLYDDSISEILAEYDGQATPNLLASYVPTGLDSNISITRSGDMHYFHPDALQSTWNLTQASDESIQNTYAYQAFGSQYGTPTEGVTNTRRFTGAEWNTEDSTQTHGVRRYHGSLARWSRRDPLDDADSSNVYLYAANKPANRIDPRGTLAVTELPPIGIKECGAAGYYTARFAYHLEDDDYGCTKLWWVQKVDVFCNIAPCECGKCKLSKSKLRDKFTYFEAIPITYPKAVFDNRGNICRDNCCGYDMTFGEARVFCDSDLPDIETEWKKNATFGNQCPRRTDKGYGKQFEQVPDWWKEDFIREEGNPASLVETRFDCCSKKACSIVPNSFDSDVSPRPNLQ